MNLSIVTDLVHQSWAALRMLLTFTVLLGVLYPGATWAVGRALGERADGQPIRVEGEVVGSRLLGQQFSSSQWFHPRPSANDYDSLASAPSNLGPSNPDLLGLIAERRETVAELEQVSPAQVPADAVTASGSGLDPHISPAYAALQIPRVAEANRLSVARVEQLVDEHTQGRTLGFIGEPRVNVLELNVAIGAASAAVTSTQGGH